MLNSIFIIFCLIAVSAFFSISEISLAASRKIKLKLLADEGSINAQRVLKMQENPGMFFTVVQIGLNAVAILGGIVGDAAFSPAFSALFVARDENSWLVDGGTPIDDVMRVLDIDEFPQSGNYETIGGFMMFMLRKIPKRTDSVKFSGYKFEVVDIDNYRIDQLLVTRLDNKSNVPAPKLPDAQGKEDSAA